MAQKRRLAGTLSPRNRLLDSYLSGLGFDAGIIERNRNWFNDLYASANRHVTTGKLGQPERRLSKKEAPHALRHELAKLKGGAK